MFVLSSRILEMGLLVQLGDGSQATAIWDVETLGRFFLAIVIIYLPTSVFRPGEGLAILMGLRCWHP